MDPLNEEKKKFSVKTNGCFVRLKYFDRVSLVLLPLMQKDDWRNPSRKPRLRLRIQRNSGGKTPNAHLSGYRGRPNFSFAPF